LKPKDASKDSSEFVEAEKSLSIRIFFSPQKRMPSISSLCLSTPVRHPTFIGLDLPLTTHVGITGKRKKLLSCTLETTRAKLKRLRLARLIHGDQKTTTRHAMALGRAKGLISLLAPIKYY
jgi:hypothetical protein